jgi:hypothetical protein
MFAWLTRTRPCWRTRPPFPTTSISGSAPARLPGRDRPAEGHRPPVPVHLLPADQAGRLRALWDEFEERRTPEARFAKATDRLEPLLLNWMARGGTWKTPGVTADDVRARKAIIGDASAALGRLARRLIDEGERRGWSRSGR